jgi:hypothetical protein
MNLCFSASSNYCFFQENKSLQCSACIVRLSTLIKTHPGSKQILFQRICAVYRNLLSLPVSQNLLSLSLPRDMCSLLFPGICAHCCFQEYVLTAVSRKMFSLLFPGTCAHCCFQEYVFTAVSRNMCSLLYFPGKKNGNLEPPACLPLMVDLTPTNHRGKDLPHFQGDSNVTFFSVFFLNQLWG